MLSSITTRLSLLFCLLACMLAVQAQDKKPELRPAEGDRYVLQPGDTIEIQYRYTPEFNQTVTVQPDGYVSLEVGGDIKVEGRNLTEVKTMVVKQANNRLQDPVVTVLLKDFQKPYIVVAGEVAQPGKFEMRQRLTAVQALMLAGGMKETARSSQVVVYRKLNLETAEVRVINLKSVNRTSDLENDISLQAGDMLYVPRSRVAKFERYVRLASITAFLNPLLH